LVTFLDFQTFTT